MYFKEPKYWWHLKEPTAREGSNINPTDKTLTRSPKIKTHGYVVKCIQGPFTRNRFFYRSFITNTEIIKLSLFNIDPC